MADIVPLNAGYRRSGFIGKHSIPGGSADRRASKRGDYGAESEARGRCTSVGEHRRPQDGERTLISRP